ncbi:zinc-finger domain-containing protein [Candidatus Tokpelaia sp.]|uniref:zinc-finger domain-containing protein n=1 Tax=Candidatus Tokpelaia sp. TaxID=2233777 RepID=UPI00123C4229|nr:zinc-finger domain-containing protein [Candidatus Tokpelaia sp.]KAA6404751.1 zinc-finger domain-containing protein [Candidatus Tokpelaia sp.]
MIQHSLPCFNSDTGSKEIFIGARKFICAGAAAPFDHPHIALNMAAENEILCPYCSTLYRFDADLPDNQLKPAGSFHTQI